jgi:hypothetical protein
MAISRDCSPIVKRLTREIRDRNLQLAALRSEYNRLALEESEMKSSIPISSSAEVIRERRERYRLMFSKS